MRSRIILVRGDITLQRVDAIVNAAHHSLLGGSGVDGAIHSAAGPQLLEECSRLSGCPTGEARITRGYNLRARWVVHTVGPVWTGGDRGEDELLARCYKSCFEIFREHGIKSAAFPSISTGAYRFPVERASLIAVREIKRSLEAMPEIQEVRAVCYNDQVYRAYHKAIKLVL